MNTMNPISFYEAKKLKSIINSSIQLKDLLNQFYLFDTFEEKSTFKPD
jgi:hypothetical protein